jgi:ribosomal protein S20
MAAKKHMIHKNNAARKKSNIAKSLGSLEKKGVKVEEAAA